MKLSLNAIKQYLDFELPPIEELVERIGAQLGAVEETEDLSHTYQGIIIVKVISCVDHPDSDHMHICMVDDGGVAKDVDRDAHGHVQVVCGAPNVHAGMMAAWLPPGSTVPESVGKDPFVLGKRELRGVTSNGMLASPKELALGDNHEGILEINPDEWSPKQSEIKPGADFAHVYGLDDTIIEIENKMFTHRPDLFGELGLSREVAGILGHPFKSPDWYASAAEFPAGSGLELQVTNESPELVPRFTTLTIKGVTVKPSPLWLQCELIRLGQKPVNNIVDVTNYIMLLTAQPTHAYDYDKLRGHQLIARMAKPDEQLMLINHKTYTLDPNDIVIADGEGVVGIAGIMGGGDSEVSDTTKNIVLECANFDMYAVRRSSMRHGLFTDALTRFNKGQSPLQNLHVLHLLMQSVFDVAGGEVGGPVTDLNHAEGREWVHPPVPVAVDFINARLGFNLSANDMATLLHNVEFDILISPDGSAITVTAPFWRTDIETREDVVEEIGRLYGFDKLPLVLPERDIKPAAKNPELAVKQAIRAKLAEAGANELLTYSFVHGDLLAKAGQDKAEAFQLSNALSPDLQYYRLSLTPSLLDVVHANIKAGYDEFALFEIGKTHGKSELDDDGLPKEFGRVALVVAAEAKYAARTYGGAPYYQALELATNLLSHFGKAELSFVPVVGTDMSNHALFQQLLNTFEPTRSALVYSGKQLLGVVGEYRRSTARALKLPDFCAGFELFLSAFAGDSAARYKPLSRFPRVTQDITLKVPVDAPHHDVYMLARQSVDAARPAETSATLVTTDIYQRDDDQAHKQVSLRLSITHHDKTLTDAEVGKLLDAVAAAAHEALGAERL